MAIELKLDKKSVGENSKTYSVFLLGFAILAGLFFVTGNKMYTKITKILEESEGLENDITLLQTKIDSLRLLDNEIQKDTKSLRLAFPDEDPSLYAYTEIKELGRLNSIIFDSVTFSLGGGDKDSVALGNIGLDFSGNKDDVFSFISKLTKIVPIAGLGPISIGEFVELEETMKIGTSVEVYYSPLPKALPSSEKVINSLTPEEKEIYNYLTNLEVLVNTELTPSGAVNEEVNPFFGTLDETPSEGELIPEP
ncbi:MAG: hypothetical protein US95_C0056G0004 [Candidatus Woesebacteria bacterium GW2011_GWB1_38_5]|uniref:Uncharacterized protein n=2 Tax=Candidatus Woeseibacteriota TaxID=1752722 RepID=A0A0G0N8G0_9BACT|nr:MAG: hypothetical protein US75_C0001G0035 [Candidatus Woesebacteria bacterium GW2011_GWC1_38_13]KKQ73421.1 MAG: hypothetical protein US95_C0056G0004 [Candidatus Woesebacteria bacterium GW2011_GWB1_38_5]